MSELNYEQGLAELENIVSALERGDIGLKESFKTYKKGIELYKKLKAMLDEGDAKIIELTQSGERELKGKNEQ